MRKYYLFFINEEYYKIYRKNPKLLYKILEKLYKMKKKDFYYGVQLYKKLCCVVNVKELKSYIVNKYYYKMMGSVIQLHSVYENTYVDINYSCVILITNVNIPIFFKILNSYGKRVFICDFLNNDYFWVFDVLKSEKKRVINI